jgi:tRNA(adenine34) deaminase
MYDDEHFMRIALEEAVKAYNKNEIPVGAIIVSADGDIAGRGHNLTELENSPLMHAEFIAIQEAVRALKTRRLSDCTMYVTLEPCPMCAGAISSARIKRLVYGAFDEKGGACASLFNLYDYPINHKPMVRSGILAGECGLLLSDFFEKLRN